MRIELTTSPILHLGPAARYGLIGTLATDAGPAAIDPDAFVIGKKTAFAGIGPNRLRTLLARETLPSALGATAYLSAPV